MSRLAGKKPKFDEPGHYDKKDRSKIPADDFGDPKNKKFPIVTQDDVEDAARLIGHAKDPEAVKKHIIEICKRKGFSLPAEWKQEQKQASKFKNRIIARMVGEGESPDGMDPEDMVGKTFSAQDNLEVWGGLNCKVDRIEGDRAWVTFNIFGRETNPIDIPLETLRPAKIYE